MELIDRRALLRDVRGMNDGWRDPKPAYDVETLIKDQPTINAVPVVRCTACKHWDSNSGLTARGCDKWLMYTKQFDYCSYEEMKTNGTDNP